MTRDSLANRFLNMVINEEIIFECNECKFAVKLTECFGVRLLILTGNGFFASPYVSQFTNPHCMVGHIELILSKGWNNLEDVKEIEVKFS